MQDQTQVRRIPTGVVAGLSVLILSTGSATAWWVWQSTARRAAAPAPSRIEQAQPMPGEQSGAPQPRVGSQPLNPEATAPITEKSLQLYWLKDTGKQIALVASSVQVKAADRPDAILSAALTQLLSENPVDTSLATTIPQGTTLRSLALKSDGIHIDLSREFTIGGGSTSMTGRVAQVLYTATSNQPDAKVWITVEGKPLESLGGEGLAMNQPLTRKDFEQDFSL